MEMEDWIAVWTEEQEKERVLRRQEIEAIRSPTRFEQIKLAVWVVSLGLTVYLAYSLFEIKRQNENRIAYETATQNVTNKYIGIMQGRGQKEFSDFAEIIQTMNREIKEEAEKNKKEF
jgi:hypothetical protein